MDGIRDQVRSRETNLGNLVADAFVFAGQQLGVEPDVDAVIGLTNGGGIRASLNAGEVTNADVISVLPFANSLALIEGLTVEDLFAALNDSVAQLPNSDGGFLHVSGIAFEYREDTHEVVRISLSDGTLLYTAVGGFMVDDDFTIDVLTNSFTAAGGDGYDMLAAYPFIDVGVSYAEALGIYIRDGLDGAVPVTFTVTRKVASPSQRRFSASLGLLLGLGLLRLTRRRA